MTANTNSFNSLADSPQVLVTGASGFVGSAIAAQCQAELLAVRTTGRSERPRANLPNYVTADLLNPVNLGVLLRNVTCVVHAAGLAHQFGKSRTNETAFMAMNTQAATSLAQAAVTAGVLHFVLISSVSVYGSHLSEECDETSPCRPEGPYAQSKHLAEQRVIEVAESAGMRLTILRLATVYGEEDPGNVIRLMRSIDRGRFIWIGTGANRKSLIHRDDVARACVAVLRSTGSGTETFNVSAPSCAMRDVVEGLAAALGRRLPGWHMPASPLLTLTKIAASLSRGRGRVGAWHGTLRKWLAEDSYNAGKFARTFTFHTQVELRDGLKREVDWYRSNG